MKIVYITAEGFDTPNPNNQMAEVMIGDFLAAGHSVHLIQSHRKGINPDVPKSLEKYDNLKVSTIKRDTVNKKNFVKRYLDAFDYANETKKYWIGETSADVIYVQSNPNSVRLMKMLHRNMKNIPIVYSIYDVFPGHAHDLGVMSTPLYEMFRLIQKPCYRIASAIAVLGEDMKDVVVKEGAKAENVYVVPAWYDVKTAHEIPREENRFIKKYNIDDDKFTVGFAGTVGYVFNYHTVIELAKRLINYDNIKIEIVGDGNVKEDFVKEAEELGLKNISFYPLQPVELVPDVYSACDIAIIPLMRGVIGNGIPSKAPILMKCHRVIVNSVEKNSHYAGMFEENNMGISVDTDDYDALADAVLMLSKSPEKVKEMADNAQKFSEENYSSSICTKKMMDVFERVAAK